MNKITFPFNGINNNNGYESQPLGTCASAQNVRGYDAIKGRLRGGQRPGLSKWFANQINGSDDVVNMNQLKATPQSDEGTPDEVLSIVNGIVYSRSLTDLSAIRDYGAATEIKGVAKDSNGCYYVATATQIKKLDTDMSTVLWTSDSLIGSIGKAQITYDPVLHYLVIARYLSTTCYGAVVLDAEDGSTKWYYVFPQDYCCYGAVIDSAGYYYFATDGADTEVGGRPIGTALYKFNNEGTIIWSWDVGADTGSLYGIDISSDDKIAIGGKVSSLGEDAGAGDKNIWVLDTNKAVSWSIKLEAGASDTVNSLRWYDDGHLLVSTDYDAAVNKTLWKIDGTDGTTIWTLDLGDEAPHQCHLTIDYDNSGIIFTAVKRNNVLGAFYNLHRIEEAADGLSATIIHSVDIDGVNDGGQCIVKPATPKLNQTSKEAITCVTADGTIKTIIDAALYTPTGGDDAMGPVSSSRPVESQPAFGKTFFVNGVVKKVYTMDYTTADDTVESWTATNGTLPYYPSLIALYRGRVVLSGDYTDPHNWYMSKVGDPFDWDYFPTTTTAIQAVAGNNSEVGLIGDNVTGIAPWSDDLCIFGCDSSLWLMAGDPAAGGSIDLITDKTGMTFGKAWCFDPNGVMYFHGVSGIFRLIPGGKPESITDDSIKRVMDSLDLSTYYIRLYWDTNQGGLYMVYIKQDYSGIGSVYFWDAKQNAWWYDEYLSIATEPRSFYAFDADAADDRYFLMGCKDGYIRKVDNVATTDDGVGIDSEVILGPYIANPGKSLRLSESDITLGKTSGNLDLHIYSGDYAEDVIVSSNTRVKRTLKAGLNRRINQRVKAPALKFKLSSPASVTTQWALENLSINIKEFGTTRGGRV